MPAPSPARGSAPTAPRCSRLQRMASASCTILCDFAALDIGNEADAAGILLGRRIIKSLRLDRPCRCALLVHADRAFCAHHFLASAPAPSACGASLLRRASPAHLGASQHPEVPRLKIGIALGGLLAQGVSAWPLESAVPPFPPAALACGAGPNRNWDSNTVLLYRAKFYPRRQGFAYAQIRFRAKFSWARGQIGCHCSSSVHRPPMPRRRSALLRSHGPQSHLDSREA